MNNVIKELAIVLPSLDPDYKFGRVVDELVEAGFENIIIVDDGSDEAHQKPFEDAGKHPQCRVLHHGINKGKGRALKTAFEYIRENLPELRGAITIDGDGQHLTKDIIRCGEVMLENGDKVVLGCRDFDQEGVPPRSVAGNKTTSRFFRLLFGIRLSDTQTGLRAIPASCLERFCGIKGERFEYETNMLLQMKEDGIGFIEQPIETVYDPDDYSSHYNAVKDSLRIAKVMGAFIIRGTAFKYVVCSAVSFLIDYLIYHAILSARGVNHVFVVQLISTGISSLFNFNGNKYWVFGKKGSYLKDMLEYYCICVPRTLISDACASTAIKALSVTMPKFAVLVRLIVDAILFVATYFLQKKWVFQTETKIM